jgi:hypothetical protein
MVGMLLTRRSLATAQDRPLRQLFLDPSFHENSEKYASEALRLARFNLELLVGGEKP